MNLILLILRLLFGRHGDGSGRLMPLAVRSDGRTHMFRRRGWFWNLLRSWREKLRDLFGEPPPRPRRGRWGFAPGGADPRQDE
jgi:hypothetical protein